MATTINGGIGIDKVQDAIVTDTKLNLSANSQAIKDALNAGGSAPIYACRAWVNFNGTGTVAIRASGNVSSITDIGTGDYTVNFATAMPDANYGISDAGTRIGSGRQIESHQIDSSSFKVYGVISLGASAGDLIDVEFIYASIFR